MGNVLKPGTTTHDRESYDAFRDGLLLGAQGVEIFRLVLLLALATVLVLAAHGLYNYGVRSQTLGAVALISLCVVAYWQLANGKIRAAIGWLVWGTSLVIVALCFFVAGIRTPALFFAPTVCLTAAWLIGIRCAVQVSMLFATAVIGLVLAEKIGLPIPNEARTATGIALVLVPAILMALLVSVGAISSFRKYMDRVFDLTREKDDQLDALRLSEERFSALFKATPMPSSTNDRDGRIIDVNMAWERLFGLRAQDVVGKTAPEAGVQTNEQDRKQAYAQLTDKGRVNGLPLRLTDGQGRNKQFLVYIAPVEFGGQQRFVTNLLDQTDRLAAEQAQRAVTEELEIRVAQRTTELTKTVADLTATQHELVQSEKLASLGAMVAGISHELNTPIGNTTTVSSALHAQVLNFRQLAESGSLRRSELAAFLQQAEEMSDLILRTTQRAAELVTSFKQVAVDRSSQRQREFEVRDLVHDIVTSLKPTLKLKQLAINISPGENVHCDSIPGAIGQVLTNLIQNAVIHAFEDRDSGTISIDVQTRGEKVVMTVSDDGAGMSSHVLKHAFDPFFTTRMGQGGSGLGLSVSHSLATGMLGGSLTAMSTPGQGSCMTFTFQRELPNPMKM